MAASAEAWAPHPALPPSTARHSPSQRSSRPCAHLPGRSNLALASLELEAALGLTAATYGLGASLFFVTYVVMQVPR